MQVEVTNQSVQINVGGKIIRVPYNTPIEAGFKKRSPENYDWLMESGFIDNITKTEFEKRAESAKAFEQAKADSKSKRAVANKAAVKVEPVVDPNAGKNTEPEGSPIVTVDGVETDVRELENFDGVTVPEAKQTAKFLPVEKLQAFMAIERDGKNRTTMIYALQEAIDDKTKGAE